MATSLMPKIHMHNMCLYLPVPAPPLLCCTHTPQALTILHQWLYHPEVVLPDKAAGIAGNIVMPQQPREHQLPLHFLQLLLAQLLKVVVSHHGWGVARTVQGQLNVQGSKVARPDGLVKLVVCVALGQNA